MSHQLIHSASLSQSQLLEVNGLELIANYGLINSLIEKDNPTPVRLAEPVKNQADDRVNWFSNLEGPVTPLDSLTPEAQRNIDHFNFFIQNASNSLINSGIIKDKKSGETLSWLLRAMTSRVYYQIGQNIVVVGWGLGAMVSLPVIKEATPEEEPAPKAAKAPKKVKPPPEPQALKKVKEPKAPKPVKVKPLVPREAFRWGVFFRKTVLGLLVGLIIGAGLIYFLEPRVYSATYTVMFGPRLNAAKFDDNAAYLAETRRDLAVAKSDFQAKRAYCLIFSQEDVLAKDYSYLDGCWADPALRFLNAYTGGPVTFSFCFSKATNLAEFTLTSEAGLRACKTRASANYLKDNLVLSAEGPAVCDGKGGDAFPRYDIQCAYGPNGAGASCALVQFDEFNSKYPAEFRINPEASGANGGQ